MAQIQYALLKWPTDGNVVSVHHLKHIRQPEKRWSDYQVGDRGLCVYPGKKGPDGDDLWRYEILAVNASRKGLEKEEKDHIRKTKEQQALAAASASQHADGENGTSQSADAEKESVEKPDKTSTKKKQRSSKGAKPKTVSHQDESDSDGAANVNFKRLRLDGKQAAAAVIMSAREPAPVAEQQSALLAKIQDNNNTDANKQPDKQHEASNFPDTETTMKTIDLDTTTEKKYTREEVRPLPYMNTDTYDYGYDSSFQSPPPNRRYERSNLNQMQFPISRPVAHYPPLQSPPTPMTDILAGAHSHIYENLDMYRGSPYNAYNHKPDTGTSTDVTTLQQQVSALRDELEGMKLAQDQLLTDVAKLKKAHNKVVRDSNADGQPLVEEPSFPTGKSKKNVEHRVNDCPDITSAIKVAMPMVFTKDELFRCSLTGQKSGKGKRVQRPAIDPARLDFLSALLMATFDDPEKKVDIKTIKDKMRNRLKLHREQYLGILDEVKENDKENDTENE